MDKKAQTATEYLIILAVVIIIALIVVGVMGGIPGIGAGAAGRASASYWRTSDLAIPQYTAFTSSEDLNITIRNNLVNSITLNTVTVGADTLTCTPSSLGTGQTSKCFHDTAGSVCSASGATFSFEVSISYADDETGATYTFTGDGHKLEGTCAD
ncbi:MAG: hypothetical protein MAG795_00633 [Candidatus Woesearchaeota archaeon]|nr:hypothetical protein [Candidatus Woesearchaeota archaeon]